MKKKKQPLNMPFQADDLKKFRLIHDIQVSPDGKTILYELQTPDPEKDEETTRLWTIPSAGGEARPFTISLGNDSNARWSPDGKQVAFLSDREDESIQIYLIHPDGGEASRLTSFDNGVASFNWGSDNRTLVVTSTIDLEKKPEDQDEEIWKNRPKVIDRLKYKADGAGFTLRKTIHLFTFDTETKEAIQLTKGHFNVSDAAFTPDMKKIAYVRTRDTKTDPFFSDLWIMDSDGKNNQQLSCEITSVSDLSWSPDGRYLAFVATDEPGKSITWPHILDTHENKIVSLFGEESEASSFVLDTANAPLWSADSKAFRYLRSRNGNSEIATIDLEKEELTVINNGDRQITLLHAADDFLAFMPVTFTVPGDIHICDFDGSNERRITSVNGDWWKDKMKFSWKRRSFTLGKDQFDGWYLSPEKAEAPYPLLVDVHGGPHSIVEQGFSYHVYWYILLSRGWSVLMLDAVGSSSYGKEFAEKLRGHWGERDLKQQLAAIEQLQAEGLADDRVAIAGKSYGGYMAAWAVGHTDRFKAAIVSAPVSNLESHAGTSDSGYYVGPYDQDAELLTHRNLYRKLSPVSYAHKVKTPTLILQGEDDQRCPVGQAEEFFTALMRNNKAPAEMVLYPEGHHDLAEAGPLSHRIDYHSRVADWVEKWCQ